MLLGSEVTKEELPSCHCPSFFPRSWRQLKFKPPPPPLPFPSSPAFYQEEKKSITQIGMHVIHESDMFCRLFSEGVGSVEVQGTTDTAMGYVIISVDNSLHSELPTLALWTLFVMPNLLNLHHTLFGQITPPPPQKKKKERNLERKKRNKWMHRQILFVFFLLL